MKTKAIKYNEAHYRALMPGTPFAVAKTLRSFHGDPKIKAQYLRRVRIHAKADEIIHGIYWENGKGCAIGCTIHSGDHSAYERELGIPRVLAKLEDGIFEGMGNGESKAWPERFLEAIHPGSDLSTVWPKFAIWLLTDEQWGVIQYARTDSRRKSIQDVSDAYKSVIEGADIMVDWFKLRNAAAAYAAASASADAAYAAAADAYASAAAASAAAAAEADAARTKSRTAQSHKLLELLEKE